MRVAYVLFLLVPCICITQALSATVEQLLPWLAPNTLTLGSSYSGFLQTHPDAQNPLLTARPKDGLFNGEMLEGIGTDSLRIYTFAKGKLASIDWTFSVNVPGTLEVVRNALVRAHGQPTIETAARVDARGSIARIVREIYRPTIEKDCVISLMATSQGVEVTLTSETVQRKHGINTTRQTYEEAARAVSAVIQPTEKPSELVDYLAAERAKSETPQPEGNPKSPVPQSPSPPPFVTPAAPASSKPAAAVPESPAPVVERKFSAWPWVVGIAALIAIIVVALKRRA